MSKLAIRPLKPHKSASEAWNNKFENVNDINTSFLDKFQANYVKFWRDICSQKGF